MCGVGWTISIISQTSHDGLPLFVCNSSFPGQIVNLHIFEPRYRQVTAAFTWRVTARLYLRACFCSSLLHATHCIVRGQADDAARFDAQPEVRAMGVRQLDLKIHF